MSLSSPTLQNPAEHFFEWKGGTGTLSFYDKEKKESVIVPLPFTFIVLDQLHTITGYDKMSKSGYWSNEVKDIRRDEFTLRTKGGVKYVGPYKNEQGIVMMPKGANYTKSVYIAHQNKAGEWIMGNIKLSGSARGAWFDFSKAHSVENGKITITKGDKETSPVGDYYPPVFNWAKWDDEEYHSAVILDKLLQQYLTQYLAAPKYDDNAEPISEDNFEDLGKATPEQIADFEKRKAAHTQLSPDDFPDNLPPPPDDFNGEAFDPSQIPF